MACRERTLHFKLPLLLCVSLLLRPNTQDASAWQEAQQGQDHIHQPEGDMVSGSSSSSSGCCVVCCQRACHANSSATSWAPHTQQHNSNQLGRDVAMLSPVATAAALVLCSCWPRAAQSNVCASPLFSLQLPLLTLCCSDEILQPGVPHSLRLQGILIGEHAWMGAGGSGAWSLSASFTCASLVGARLLRVSLRTSSAPTVPDSSSMFVLRFLVLVLCRWPCAGVQQAADLPAG